MGWDDVAGKAMENDNEKYIVLQIVLTEKFIATGFWSCKSYKLTE